MQTGLARTLFFRREERVPGADYLTQILGIEQTIVGRGVCPLKSPDSGVGKGTSTTIEARSATPMKQIVNDDWTVGVAATTF